MSTDSRHEHRFPT